MLTNANKGTYLVKSWQEYANVIYERPLKKNKRLHSGNLSFQIANEVATSWLACWLLQLVERSKVDVAIEGPKSGDNLVLHVLKCTLFCALFSI